MSSCVIHLKKSTVSRLAFPLIFQISKQISESDHKPSDDVGKFQKLSDDLGDKFWAIFGNLQKSFLSVGD